MPIGQGEPAIDIHHTLQAIQVPPSTVRSIIDLRTLQPPNGRSLRRAVRIPPYSRCCHIRQHRHSPCRPCQTVPATLRRLKDYTTRTSGDFPKRRSPYRGSKKLVLKSMTNFGSTLEAIRCFFRRAATRGQTMEIDGNFSTQSIVVAFASGVSTVWRGSRLVIWPWLSASSLSDIWPTETTALMSSAR